MRKLLIIDDEYLVRIGIRETIEWDKYDIEIIGEAVNGKKGLELTLELKPDIVISDIRMPVMDGLDYLKAVKEKELDVAVVMLSGYKDFEYAKEALVNGAEQYLLKPIDNNELIKAVILALEKLDSKRKNNQRIKSIENDLELINNAIILDILQKEYNHEIINEKIDSYNLNISSNGQLAYIKLDNNTNANNLELQKITEKIATAFQEANLTYSICHEENVVIFIINSLDNNTASTILSSIIDNTKIENNTLSAYLSEPYNELESLSKVYKLAKNAVKNKFFLSINTFISSIISDDKKFHKTVISGLSYIKDNYKQDISIRTCAEKLYVSESHLMHLFKDELGKTFNECLTEYRMYQAKKLLSTNKYKVYEVSYMVGYNDTKYFSQVFKKINGISPNDFINKNYEE